MKLLIALFLLQFPIFLSAQNSGYTKDLYDSAEKMAYSNPVKALKFTRYIIADSDKTSTDTAIFEALLLQSEIQIAQQNMSEAALSLSQCSKFIEDGQSSLLLSKYYFLLSKVLLQLNMTAQFENNLIQLKNVSASLNKGQRKSAENWSVELMILKTFHAGDFQESLKLIKSSNYLSNISDIGFHDRISLIKKSIFLINGILDDKNDSLKTPFYKYLFSILETKYEVKSGRLNPEKLKALEEAQLYFGGENGPDLYSQIAKTTCANNETTDCFYFKNEYIKRLKNKVTSNQNARLTMLNVLQDNAQYFQKRTKQKWIEATIISGSIAFTILSALVIYYIFLRSKLKKLKLKTENEKLLNDLKEKLSVQPKNILIPAKTEQIILQKLVDFEKNEQYLNPQISLSFLATYLETNSKYLSEVINKHKDKNFNAYINELRINYIINKLKNNPEYRQYKSSVLAAEAGFASRTSFSTIFKNITGKSLTQFTEQLENDHP